MNNQKICEYCGDASGKYNLCHDCYQLAQDETIIQTKNGTWIENIKKGIEYKFYDETKTYTLKSELLNEYEMRFFNIIRKNLKSKYFIVPQVNLQTIIETNTNTRNDELFRNIDFIIYNSKYYSPILAIELNGQQHYTNPYWRERDKSIKAILKDAELPLITIDIKDLKKITDKNLKKAINEIIEYVNPGFLAKLSGKKNNKMVLGWAHQMIKDLAQN